MVKENGMVTLTEDEFKRICKCYEKNIADQKDEHEYETDLICKDYERTIDALKQEHQDQLDRSERKARSLENELKQVKKAYEKRLELMHTALLKSTADNKVVEGVHVTKTDFLAIYQKALDDMFAKEENGTLDPYCNDIYGYDFTIHWHGIYCNCYDGAIPSNHIIPAIEGLNEEDPDEGWGGF